MQPTVIDEICQYVNQGEYEKAKIKMDQVKAGGYPLDDTAAILDADICRALGDRAGMFRAIRSGLKYNYRSYELYDMLGYYYLPVNKDQAFLCFQNALFYCDREEDAEIIETEMKELRHFGQTAVKDTAIVIVSYNSCYLMEKNIECIRQTMPKDSYKIIVVDNASGDGVTEWLQEQDDIVLIKNKENIGFPRACNQGAAAAFAMEGDEADIFLLNNDTRLAPNAFFWLKMGLYENDEIGAVGSRSNYAGNNQQMDMEFLLPTDYLEYGAKNINIPEEQPYEERVRLSGFAMLIKSGIWKITGGFDEQFSPGYFEDDDLSMKILKSGHRLMVCRNSFIYHAGSQSFSGRSDVESILLNHYDLFCRTYGFDILELAYPDEISISDLPFGREDEFNLLQIGSGLGADLKYLHTRFPKAHVIGIEADEAAWRISKCTDAVFQSVSSLKEVLKQPVFHVLLTNGKKRINLSGEDWKAIAGMCRGDCIVLPKNETKKGLSPEKIKLVIWDLDNTFWKGILSEGSIEPVEDHILLVKSLTDHGIINSVSSKNNRDEAMETLKKLGMDEYFVFPDINWEGKGKQIRQKLSDMGLRAENVLFLDDDVRNLEEAKYFNEGIMTGGSDLVPVLADYINGLERADVSHKRLERYHILEKKRKAESRFDSREKFLYYSGIRIGLENDCMKELDRIAELVARTNQLNYTKIRDTREELYQLLSNPYVAKGCIRVEDRFGDYGVAGFYCFDEKNEKIRHFLFSCRVIGMGIEQCVYGMLGFPEINVKEPVAVELAPERETPWITVGMADAGGSVNEKPLKNTDHKIKILFKGPCDLSAIESYLSGGNLVTEFNYVNEQGFITTGQNHSMHIRESSEYTDEQIEEILSDVPFLTKGDFETDLFREEFHVICYSLLPDCHAGLYKNKKTGAYVSFGSRNFDLTEPSNWEGYINGTIVNHLFPFTEEVLRKFSEEWEFEGATSADDLIGNLDYIYNHVKGNPLLILFLGSEKEYEGENEEFAGHAAFHKEINNRIKAYAAEKERIQIINMTDFIRSQDDYEDCINHFSRNVYYDLATAVCSLINDKCH